MVTHQNERFKMNSRLGSSKTYSSTLRTLGFLLIIILAPVGSVVGMMSGKTWMGVLLGVIGFTIGWMVYSSRFVSRQLSVCAIEELFIPAILLAIALLMGMMKVYDLKKILFIFGLLSVLYVYLVLTAFVASVVRTRLQERFAFHLM
jgi:hydrogenase-4 membrane subunit HyfE